MSRCTADIEVSRELFGPAILHSANAASAIVTTVIAMFFLNWTLTVWVIAPTAVVLIAMYFWMQVLYERGMDVQTRMADISAKAQETFSGMSVIKAFCREPFETKQMENKCDDYQASLLTYVFQRGLMRSGMQSFLGALYVIVLFVGGHRVMQGEMTVGHLFSFILFQARFMWPLIAIGWVAGMFQRGSAAMDRIQKIFSTVPEIQDAKDVRSMEKLHGAIEIKNLDFQYSEDGPEILHDISLSISAGTQLAIVGATGAGKSTLIKLLMRMHTVPRGKIFYDDTDINQIPLKVLRDNIACVTQLPFLFSDTITYNIAFGLQENPQPNEVEKVATLADVHSDIIRFEYGYDQILGERGVTLSGGQKQRTAIARALIKNAPILIMDDSLSAVDTETEETILNNFKQKMDHCTRIIIAHRISTIQHSDSIIVLDDGRIVEQGKHTELLKQNGRYAELYQLERIKSELEQID